MEGLDLEVSPRPVITLMCMNVITQSCRDTSLCFFSCVPKTQTQHAPPRLSLFSAAPPQGPSDVEICFRAQTQCNT